MKIKEDYVDLIKEDISCDNVKIFHFEKELGNYCANIICCQFDTEKDLKMFWKEIIDNVAVYIQAKLSEIIELYNVYVIFFAQKIDEKLLYIIEQDKYSSRKIVIQKKIPDSITELKEMLENRLFKFSSEKSQECFQLDKQLKDYNKKFYNFIKDIENIDDEILNVAIEIL